MCHISMTNIKINLFTTKHHGYALPSSFKIYDLIKFGEL